MIYQCTINAIDAVVETLERHFVAADRLDLLAPGGNTSARTLANDLSAVLDLLEEVRFDVEDEVVEDTDLRVEA